MPNFVSLCFLAAELSALIQTDRQTVRKTNECGLIDAAYQALIYNNL